jgi:hypothetical protein
MKAKAHPISSDFVLAISSLLIAFVIWLIAAEADIETDTLTVPVTVVNAPLNYRVDVVPKQTIIAIQYPKAQKSTIIVPHFTVVVDLANISEFDRGEEEFSTSWLLNPIDVRKTGVSDRVKVIEIVSPKRISIRAKMNIETAKIQPTITGKLHEGFRMPEPPRARPSMVEVTGPQPTLDFLKQRFDGTITLETTPVDISNENGSFFRIVRVLLPNNLQLVNPENRSVEVIVAMEEKETSRTISRVPIEVKTFSQNIRVSFEPEFATVSVRAPLSIVRDLAAEHFYCEPVQPVEESGFRGKVAIEAKFRESVPPSIRERVSIQAVSPEVIDLVITQESEEAE